MASCESGRFCSRGHEFPSLDLVCSTSEMSSDDILNVYIVGSHVWETCSKSSDWDLIVVMKARSSTSSSLNLHRGSIDILKLTVDKYIEQLDAHSMQVLLTLWLPKESILLQRFNPNSRFVFSKLKLVEALSTVKDRDLRIAEKHFRKGNAHQAKKVLMHFIRYVDIGIQIKDVGLSGTVKYSSANCFRGEVLNNSSKTWEELIMSLQPLMDGLWSKLN